MKPILKSAFCSLLFSMLLNSNAALAQDSHDPDNAPDYATVFNSDKIHEITIHLDPETYEAMQADRIDILGKPGTGGGPGGGGFGGPGPADRAAA